MIEGGTHDIYWKFMIGNNGNKEKQLIAPHEIMSIERIAVRMPSKDGNIAPRIIRAFIKHVADVYGIDLMMETEEMRDEREAKEARSKSKRTNRMGGKPRRDDPDSDF